MDERIFEKVKKIVSTQLSVAEDEVKKDSSFVDDLGADSLDLVELIMALEEEFAIQISDEEAQGIRTVGEAVDFIEQKMV